MKALCGYKLNNKFIKRKKEFAEIAIYFRHALQYTTMVYK